MNIIIRVELFEECTIVQQSRYVFILILHIYETEECIHITYEKGGIPNVLIVNFVLYALFDSI